MPEEARVELLDDVRAQIEEMTTLIGDLVELARDEPLPHVVEPVDVAEVLHRAVARVRRRAPGITVDVTADEWWVIGESGALERAVTNLLDNAVKWSPPAGTVTVRLDRGRLTVRDQGPGIGADDLPHVFDRFYRSAGVAVDARLRPRALDRAPGGAAPLGHRARLARPGGGTLMTLRLPGTAHPPVRV